ncbi:MAG: YeeE/YedE family protein [Paracoccus sp. (in: a-proteobacteria)]|uniref:YeeE/YedE family protein n=1 Tax=Paracoccus sp. TaxID=267 RepID=UPI0026DF96FB|nr:YeeE/YedE family protein [Paracoccus sp. (in: a-proteobacteria)]MDO5621865.1 YeeE/YedE family protein [Paracoccus sp. (in: a-proteobacteria)]
MPSEWIYGLIGGLMIGGAAAMLLLLNGRIMGASGIIGGLVDAALGRRDSQTAERAALVAGLLAGPLVLIGLDWPAQTAPVAGPGLLVLAGLLVGFGTRLANGCTSGHGVCGISRLSWRGIMATMTYLLAGGVAVIAARALGAA